VPVSFYKRPSTWECNPRLLRGVLAVLRSASNSSSRVNVCRYTWPCNYSSSRWRDNIFPVSGRRYPPDTSGNKTNRRNRVIVKRFSCPRRLQNFDARTRATVVRIFRTVLKNTFIICLSARKTRVLRTSDWNNIIIHRAKSEAIVRITEFLLRLNTKLRRNG